MNATKTRGTRSLPAPTPEKGVLIRQKALCDKCYDDCKVSSYAGGNEDGYYTFYDKKLCRVCIRGTI